MTTETFGRQSQEATDIDIFQFGPSQDDLPGDQEPGTWLGHPWTCRTTSSETSSGGTGAGGSLLAGSVSFGKLRGIQGGPVRGRGRGSNYSYQHSKGGAHARLPRSAYCAAEHVGKTTIPLSITDPFKAGQSDDRIRSRSGRKAQDWVHKTASTPE
jgi:hypothetical protein